MVFLEVRRGALRRAPVLRRGIPLRLCLVAQAVARVLRRGIPLRLCLVAQAVARVLAAVSRV